MSCSQAQVEICSIRCQQDPVVQDPCWPLVVVEVDVVDELGVLAEPLPITELLPALLVVVFAWLALLTVELLAWFALLVVVDVVVFVTGPWPSLLILVIPLMTLAPSQ